ncbi:hypothetical protein [Aquimarina sp. AU474]|uniref:hypothetical protein n=1 Tax=Aquimarina sp. AU474 TaxID=2108529 RepID=UPI000D68A758|nr:hypothetical protein [Aquimarina sp. AU474]
MKNFFLLSICIILFSCKQNPKPQIDNTISQETIIPEQHGSDNNHENQSANFVKVQINNKEIQGVNFEFKGSGSKEIGLTNELSFEIPEGIFDDKYHEIYFNAKKNTLPHMLEVGSYTIDGIESDEKFLKNESYVYCTKALNIDTYNKMLETYGTMNKEDFLKILHFDFVIIPDDKNKFNIESIEEIKGEKEFTEIAGGKGMTINAFLIKGDFQLKLMQVATKKEFIIKSQFKSEYNYNYSDF